MTRRPDVHIAWVNAKALAWVWIGAVLFPFIHAMPLGQPMFWVCAGAGLLVLASMVDGLRALRRRRLSDWIAQTVVPGLLMLGSALFNLLAA